jgi:hypothetical protein
MFMVSGRVSLATLLELKFRHGRLANCMEREFCG